jgi:dihydroceramidase
MVYEMERHLNPSGKHRSTSVSKAKQNSRTKESIRRLETMRMLGITGVGSVLVGFLIWNLDNNYCSKLRLWRETIGLPWGILLEGHGWW